MEILSLARAPSTGHSACAKDLWASLAQRCTGVSAASRPQALSGRPSQCRGAWRPQRPGTASRPRTPPPSQRRTAGHEIAGLGVLWSVKQAMRLRRTPTMCSQSRVPQPRWLLLPFFHPSPRRTLPMALPPATASAVATPCPATAPATTPTGDDAAARAMVAMKDLSPHSAAKTSANVDSTRAADSCGGQDHWASTWHADLVPSCHARWGCHPCTTATRRMAHESARDNPPVHRTMDSTMRKTRWLVPTHSSPSTCSLATPFLALSLNDPSSRTSPASSFSSAAFVVKDSAPDSVRTPNHTRRATDRRSSQGMPVFGRSWGGRDERGRRAGRLDQDRGGGTPMWPSLPFFG